MSFHFLFSSSSSCLSLSLLIRSDLINNRNPFKKQRRGGITKRHRLSKNLTYLSKQDIITDSSILWLMTFVVVNRLPLFKVEKSTNFFFLCLKPFNGRGGGGGAAAPWPCFLASLPCCQQPFVTPAWISTWDWLVPRRFSHFSSSLQHTSQLTLDVSKDRGLPASFVLCPRVSLPGIAKF